jgi:hypothetical protein
MALRVIAISVAICGCLMLAAKWLLASESSLESSALRSPSEAARPCLLSLDRCLDQSAAPFTLCLVSVERCSGEGKLEKLVANTGRAELPPRESPRR